MIHIIGTVHNSEQKTENRIRSEFYNIIHES
jgi:hypothetical protein